MTKDGFWNLIDASRRGAEVVDDQMGKLHDILVELPDQEILSFDACFQECIRDAYTWELWGAAYLMTDGCSDDGFDYFLGWLVAQGRQTFESALADPESLAEVVGPDGCFECEQMWSAPAVAYEAKTQKNDFYEIAKGLKRQLRGNSWESETVATRYPKLARMFGR